MVYEIDFNGYISREFKKLIQFFNEDNSLYDFSNSGNVVLKLYKDNENPLTIVGVKNIPNSTVEFTFDPVTHNNELGRWEYVIEDNKTDSSVIKIGHGNYAVSEYTGFSSSVLSFLHTELPTNIQLTANFINQRLMYWRLILQDAFEITDANLSQDSAWPTLVNAMLAKLVVYDALDQASRGAYMQFIGYQNNQATPQGTIKKVETGPTSVEHFDISTAVKNALYAPQGGKSFFEVITESLCGLANRLKVKLPMCSGNKICISPIVYKN